MAIVRRSPFPASLRAAGAAVILSAVIAGCGKTSVTEATSTGSTTTGAPSGGPAASDAISVGFIYVGPKDDYGYNQAHADGAAAVRKMSGVKVMEEERVPETADPVLLVRQ